MQTVARWGRCIPQTLWRRMARLGIEKFSLCWHPKVHHTQCQRYWQPVRSGIALGPPKLKFLQRFYQNPQYKCPATAYPLRDFHEIYRVCTSLQYALTVKIWMDLLKGLQSYRRFKLRVWFRPNFQHPLAAILRQTPKVLHAQERAKCWVFCLSVCPSHC